MKKLLGLLAISPLAITACGGAAGLTVEGVSVGSNTGIMDGILNETIDFAGTWGDARFNATDETNVYTDVVAIGVEKSRVANDGVQAKPTMSAEDMFHAQELFMEVAATPEITAVIGEDDDGKDKVDHVLELYGHEAYDPIRDDSRQVTYLDAGKPVEKDFISKTPVDAEGTIFNAAGKVKDGQTLNIEFIPSTDTEFVTAASSALQTWLQANAGASANANINVTVAANYDAAATKLENGTIDLAFLPVNTWATGAASSQFILQAGRSAQVATLDYDATATTKVWQPSVMVNQKLTTEVMNRFSQLYVEDVTNAAISANDTADAADKDENITEFNIALTTSTDPMHDWAVAVNAAATANELPTVAGSYESYIWSHKDNAITKAVQAIYAEDHDADWTVDIADMDLKYGYTSTTSSSTYVFPELWLKRHLDATIKLS